MKIEQLQILNVLGAPDRRFAIPVFQRVYSWSARQCEELWSDVERAGRTGKPHFMGLLLCSHDPEGWHGMEQLNVIDGQQRLTTLTLLVSAFRAYLDRGGECAGLTADALADRYLVADSGDSPSPKLVLSQMDRETLAALVGAAEPPEAPAQRILDNCLLFANKMDEQGFDAELFWKGLELLEVALVQLGPDDSPQVVFENLNSKGMSLSIADQVRNLIVASTEGEEQERLYTGSWVPIEDVAAAAQPPAAVSDVLHAWLVQDYRSVHIAEKSETYGVLKTCLRERYGGSLERLLADVRTFADRFLNDSEFREEQQREADAWVAGKPKDSISELKLFGD